jgi:hypothetical protein
MCSCVRCAPAVVICSYTEGVLLLVYLLLFLALHLLKFSAQRVLNFDHLDIQILLIYFLKEYFTKVRHLSLF